jgi:hypothetical protein
MSANPKRMIWLLEKVESTVRSRFTRRDRVFIFTGSHFCLITSDCVGVGTISRLVTRSLVKIWLTCLWSHAVTWIQSFTLSYYLITSSVYAQVSACSLSLARSFIEINLAIRVRQTSCSWLVLFAYLNFSFVVTECKLVRTNIECRTGHLCKVFLVVSTIGILNASLLR